MQTTLAYGHQLLPNEIEVIDNVLKHGRGLCVRFKKDLADYPNLIDNQLVYIDNWGSGKSIVLKPTLKGEGFFNNLVQQ